MSVFVFGHPIFKVSTLKNVDWGISKFTMTREGFIDITLEKGLRVENFKISTEVAEEIGLINLDALNRIFNR
jgi:hypothetical protein